MDVPSSHRAISGAPSPLTLSPSAINDFLTCRLRYVLSYVTPLSPQERQPVSLLAFGEAIHKVIADFHRLGGWGQVAREDLATLLGSHWPEGIYADDTIDEANRGRALELLERFFDTPFPDHVVKELGIEQRHSWKRFRRGILATGRIDRACQLADGTIMLIDYKCGARPRAVETLRRDPQAILYRSLGSEVYGYLAPARMLVVFFYLATGTAVTVEFDKEDFMAGWARIERVADAIRAGMAAVIAGAPVVNAFPPRRGVWCLRCPMRWHCDGLERAGAFNGTESGLDGGAA